MAQKRSTQVRVPNDVQHDIGIIAAAEGVSVPDYVERILREAIRRDLPKASRTVTSRAEAIKDAKEKPVAK